MKLGPLQEIHKDHYEKAGDLLARYLLTALEEMPTRTLNILEVGPGDISILLQSIVNCSKSMNTDDRKGHIRICFVDHMVHERHEKIRSRDDQLSFLLEKNEFEYKDTLKINLEASLIRQEFNSFLGTNRGNLLDISSTRRFDFIVMHSVLHELYISARETADRYFPYLFKNLYTLLSDEGILFFGDPYYAPYHGTIESLAFIDNLIKETEHANAPVAFLHPEFLLTMLFKRRMEEHNMQFNLLVDEEVYITYKNRGRKFYLIVLQKVGEAK